MGCSGTFKPRGYYNQLGLKGDSNERNQGVFEKKIYERLVNHSRKRGIA